MLDAYIIDRLHQKKERVQSEQPRIEIRDYCPDTRQNHKLEQKQQRGVEVIDFTI